MLEGLDKIDWSAVKVFSRDRIDPTQIPIFLRKLLSDDKEVRRYYLDALESELIFNEIGHLPNEAMIPTLPFLFELLRSNEFQEKAKTLAFLNHVSWESSGSVTNRLYDGDDLISQYFRFFENNCDVLIQLITDESRIVRLNGISAWSHVSVDDDTFERVFKMINNDPDEDVQILVARHVIEFILSNQDLDQILYSEAIALVLRKFNDTTELPHRGMLAYGILKLLKDKSPIQAINILVDSWIQREEFS
jgi:hypothetical protein